MRRTCNEGEAEAERIAVGVDAAVKFGGSRDGRPESGNGDSIDERVDIVGYVLELEIGWC